MNWLKLGLGSLQSLSPLGQIGLWCIVLLLGSTLLLGGLLKRSYEQNGRLSARVVELTKDVKERDTQLKLYAKSSQITDNLSAEGNTQKEGIRGATTQAIQDLCNGDKGPVNEKSKVAPRSSVLTDKSDRVLREQYNRIQATIAP